MVDFSWSSLLGIFIIGIIILVIFAAIAIILILPNLGINFVFEWLQGAGTSAPEAIVLQNAIQCSFDRCVYGCNSDQVKNLKYSIGGNFFDCTQFCKPEWTNTGIIDGKICDDKAKANPVVAYVASNQGEKISLSKLSFAPCILQTDKCSPTTDFQKVIYIEQSIAKENSATTATCPIKLPQTEGILGISSIVIKQGTYKIWTNSYYQLSRGQATYVCSS